MVEVAWERAGGDEFETYTMSASVFLDSPMFTAASTFPHHRMMREEVVTDEPFDHISLFLAEYTSQNPWWTKHLDKVAVLHKDVIFHILQVSGNGL